MYHLGLCPLPLTIALICRFDNQLAEFKLLRLCVRPTLLTAVETIIQPIRTCSQDRTKRRGMSRVELAQNLDRDVLTKICRARLSDLQATEQ